MSDAVHEAGGCCASCKSEVERGREELLSTADAFTALTAAELLQKTGPAMQRLVAERLRMQRPVKPQLKLFELHIKIDGKKGDKVFHVMQVDHHCRGEKFEVFGGVEGVRILNLAGFALEHEESRSASRWTREAQALGCGMTIGTFSPNRPFTIEVEFVADCTFEAAVIGVAVVSQ